MDVVDIPVLCGPTGSGKSAAAMMLAAGEPVTIISADSRQVYRRFDVGTAKPGAAELAAVPHEGVDIVDPEVRYSAAAWAESARRWIVAAHAAGRVPLVVGGTGLYLRALLEGLFEEPPMDAGRRAELGRMLDAMETAELRRWVMELDPSRAHLGRVQLLRAIEVALLGGQRISTLHARGTGQGGTAADGTELRGHYLALDPGDRLAGWNEARVDRMFAAGWVDEVRELLTAVSPDAPAWNSTGYGAIRALVAGELTAEAARERVIIETRQYAKRQRTWFRHQLPADRVARLDPVAPGFSVELAAWWRGATGRG